MNEITKTTPNNLMAHNTSQAGEAVLKSDIQAPWILLQQGLSDFVSDGRAVSGDIVSSVSAKKLGDKGNPVEFLPIAMKAQWTLSEVVGGKAEYRKTLPRDSGFQDAGKSDLDKTGETLEWDFTFNNMPWKRTKTLTVYSLLVKDIANFNEELTKAKETGEFDLDSALMPYLIGFRNTSYNAGKTVSTQFFKAQSMAAYGARPYSNTLMLGCTLQKNDRGSFYVYTVTPGRKANKDELFHCEQAYQAISSGRVKASEDPSAVKSDDAGSLSNEY